MPLIAEDQPSRLEGAVRDQETCTGTAGHEELLRSDRLECAGEIALMNFRWHCRKPFASRPGSRDLRPTREFWLSAMIEEIVKIGGTGARQIQIGVISVLRHRLPE
jgi:hypothetical protein